MRGEAWRSWLRYSDLNPLLLNPRSFVHISAWKFRVHQSNGQLLDIVAAIGNLVTTLINPTQIDFAYINKHKTNVVNFL